VLFTLILASWNPTTSSVQALPTTNTLLLPSIADSYVDSKNLVVDSRVNNNYGRLERLEVYYWHGFGVITEERFTYLMFNLPDFPNGTNIRSACLKLYAKEASVTLRVAAHYSSDNSWNETRITWNNKPQWTIQSTYSLAVATPNKWYSWDVTKDVKTTLQTADKFLTIVMIPDETGDLDATVHFYSREGPENFRPYLEITYDKINPILSLDPVGDKGLHEAFRISGSFAPARLGITITLTITDPDGQAEARTAKTDSQGNYHIDYAANKEGLWKVIAKSESDQFFEESTSSEVSFNVRPDPLMKFLSDWGWLITLIVIAVIVAVYLDIRSKRSRWA